MRTPAEIFKFAQTELTSTGAFRQVYKKGAYMCNVVESLLINGYINEDESKACLIEIGLLMVQIDPAEYNLAMADGKRYIGAMSAAFCRSALAHRGIKEDKLTDYDYLFGVASTEVEPLLFELYADWENRESKVNAIKAALDAVILERLEG